MQSQCKVPDLAILRAVGRQCFAPGGFSEPSLTSSDESNFAVQPEHAIEFLKSCHVVLLWIHGEPSESSELREENTLNCFKSLIDSFKSSLSSA
jgi:hypothetical protein